MNTEKSHIRRFLVSAVLTMALDLFLYTLLSEISGLSGSFAYIIFRSISFLTALVLGFNLNKLWVFNNPYLDKEELKMQIRGFLAVSITGLVFYSVVAPALGILFVAGIPGMSEKLLMRLATLLSMFVSLTWSYFGYKIAVFNRESLEPIAARASTRHLRLQKR